MLRNAMQTDRIDFHCSVFIVIKKAHMRTKKRVNANEGTGATAASAGANTGDAATPAPAATTAEDTTAAGPSPKKPRSETNANNGEGAGAAVATTSSDANSVPSTSTATASTSNAQPAAATATATATSSSSAPTPTDVNLVDDREQVFQFVFCNGGQEYLKYLNEKPALGVGAERLKALQTLKTNENVDSAVKAIQRHKFTIDQMPAHLLEQQKIWDALLPTLSTRSLLRHFHTMKDHGFLNENSAFAQKFLDIFGKPDAMKSENICPIDVYIQKVLYTKNMRYLCLKKAEYYKKKMEKRKVTTNPLIVKRLDEVFDQALRHAKPVAAKFFVVMDLRRGNAKSKSDNAFGT